MASPVAKAALEGENILVTMLGYPARDSGFPLWEGPMFEGNLSYQRAQLTAMGVQSPLLES